MLIMSLSSSCPCPSTTGDTITDEKIVNNENDDDKLLLNFHDAVIYQRDLNLLLNKHGWLNDSIIHFYFEYLQQQSPSNDDYFMDPSVVSYFMHQCIENDDIQEFVHSAPFPRPTTRGTTGRIFIAVNDYMMPFSSSSSSSSSLHATAQGTHWSLLVLHIHFLLHCDGDNEKDMPVVLAHHFDSLGKTSTNHLVARKIVEKILAHVYQHPHVNITTTTSTTTVTTTNTTMDCYDAKVFVLDASSNRKIPQQVNGYDCGVHVLGAAEILSKTKTAKSSLVSSWSNRNSIIDHKSNTDNPTNATLSSSSSSSFYLAQLQGESNEQTVRQHIGSDPARFCADLRKKITSIIRLAARQQIS
jgi:hypothetical protein